MKVFKIEPCWDHRGNYAFASLNNGPRHAALLRTQVGRGVKASEWRPIRLFIDNPGKPIPDIFSFGAHYVLSEETCQKVGAAIRPAGELLAVAIEGFPGNYFLYNSTTVIDVVNPEQSIWEFYKLRNSSKIVVPAFYPDRFNEHSIFKYPKEGLGGLFVVERNDGGDLRENEFKALVEKNELTGIKFKLLWNDAEGPVVPSKLWGPEDPFEYCRFDGTPWVVSKSKSQQKRPRMRRS